MKTDMKPRTAWAIVDPFGEILIWTVNKDRDYCRAAFWASETVDDSLLEPEAFGYRVIRVRIEAIEQEDEE